MVQPPRDVRRGLAGPPRACVAFTDCVDVPPVHGVKHATAGDRKVLDVRLRARADGEKSGTARSGRSGGGAGARSIPMKDALAFACIVVAAVAAPAPKPVQLAASPNIWIDEADEPLEGSPRSTLFGASIDERETRGVFDARRRPSAGFVGRALGSEEHPTLGLEEHPSLDEWI